MSSTKTETVAAQEPLTLAEIKRRAKADVEGENDDHGRRYRTLNFTSETSRAADEHQLNSYYCGVCGMHSLVMEGELTTAPKFEKTLVLETGKVFYKSYMTQSDSVNIKRPEGVECRIMFRCRQCEFPLAYRVNDAANAMTPYFYLFDDAFVAKQPQADAFCYLEPSLATAT